MRDRQENANKQVVTIGEDIAVQQSNIVSDLNCKRLRGESMERVSSDPSVVTINTPTSSIETNDEDTGLCSPNDTVVRKTNASSIKADE